MLTLHISVFTSVRSTMTRVLPRQTLKVTFKEMTGASWAARSEHQQHGLHSHLATRPHQKSPKHQTRCELDIPGLECSCWIGTASNSSIGDLSSPHDEYVNRFAPKLKHLPTATPERHTPP